MPFLLGVRDALYRQALIGRCHAGQLAVTDAPGRPLKSGFLQRGHLEEARCQLDTLFQSFLLDCPICSDLIMVEGKCLAVSLLDSLLCHVDHVVVQTVIDVVREAELLADRHQHGHLLRRCPSLASTSILSVIILVLAGKTLGVASGSNFSEPMLTFVNAFLCNVDLVDGLGGRVVDAGSDGRLANAEAILVDELHQKSALLVGHG